MNIGCWRGTTGSDEVAWYVRISWAPVPFGISHPGSILCLGGSCVTARCANTPSLAQVMLFLCLPIFSLGKVLLASKRRAEKLVLYRHLMGCCLNHRGQFRKACLKFAWGPNASWHSRRARSSVVYRIQLLYCTPPATKSGMVGLAETSRAVHKSRTLQQLLANTQPMNLCFDHIVPDSNQRRSN
jgi:hypothetical protein